MHFYNASLNFEIFLIYTVFILKWLAVKRNIVNLRPNFIIAELPHEIALTYSNIFERDIDGV